MHDVMQIHGVRGGLPLPSQLGERPELPQRGAEQNQAEH